MDRAYRILWHARRRVVSVGRVAGLSALLFAIPGGLPQRAAAADGGGSLVVESDPAGASVFGDGHDLCGAVGSRLPRDGDAQRDDGVDSRHEDSEAKLMTRPAIAFVVTALIALPQTAPSQAALKVVVLEGEGAVNIIRQRTATAPVVEVRDQNDLPVAGVPVTFSIGGSGATFGSSSTLTVVTNAAGRAVATGLTPTVSGSLQIGVSAAFQGQTAVATIAQMNVLTAAQAAGAGAAAAGSGGAAGGSGGGLSVTTLSIVGAAAAGGAVVAAQALGESPQTPDVTDSFTGFTEVLPGFAYSAVRSTPPFTIREAQTVALRVSVTAPQTVRLTSVRAR